MRRKVADLEAIAFKRGGYGVERCATASPDSRGGTLFRGGDFGDEGHVLDVRVNGPVAPCGAQKDMDAISVNDGRRLDSAAYKA